MIPWSSEVREDTNTDTLAIVNFVWVRLLQKKKKTSCTAWQEKIFWEWNKWCLDGLWMTLHFLGQGAFSNVLQSPLEDVLYK